MQIKIDNERKIFEIQKEFNTLFPYLKLEFFSKPHKTGGPTSRKFVQHSSQSLSECRASHESGTITISPGMTVTELEQNFKEGYGLNVQVFRKSGKIWLETTVTDSWTLEKQNNEGRELSSPLI